MKLWHNHFNLLTYINMPFIVIFAFIFIRSIVDAKQRNNNNFKVYWNVPTFMCHKYGFNFSEVQDEWGIVQNYKDEFRGDKVVILYDPGKFPAMLNTTSTSPPELRNGGVPQEGNISLHLSLLERDINKLIPDKNFKGVAIIDFEHWRPIWREMWGSLMQYRTYTKELLRKNHPWWNNSMIEKEAEIRYEKGAKRFMYDSLLLAKKMRPFAVWAYYGYPFCFNYTPRNPKYTCSDEVVADNNRLKWLFGESTALYPSNYLKIEGMNEFSRAKFILGRMQEAIRISKKYSSTPVYPYVWYRYHDANRFLSKEDAKNSFDIPKKNGASGAIIWGASNDINTAVKCKALHDYLQRILGPIVQQVMSNKKHNDFNSLSLKDSYNEIIQKDYMFNNLNDIDV